MTSAGTTPPRCGLAATTTNGDKSYLLHELALMDAAKGWTMQIHYGALRGANTRMKKLLGADCGFDSIGDLPVAAALAKHLDRLDLAGSLPKTIIYILNPRENELVATMLGNFPILPIGNGTPRANPGPLENGSRPATAYHEPDMTLHFNQFHNRRLIPKSRIKPRRSVGKNIQKLTADKKWPAPNRLWRLKTPCLRLSRASDGATFQAQPACPPLPGVPFQT